mmetsp:Transcript_874/g.1442  ORF Transcript_874/g.1442 Transcript_874/m.1442 type:complete len:87 (-) Transcript_874:351-611(-)
MGCRRHLAMTAAPTGAARAVHSPRRPRNSKSVALSSNHLAHFLFVSSDQHPAACRAAAILPAHTSSPPIGGHTVLYSVSFRPICPM